jgi:hypothetical protein
MTLDLIRRLVKGTPLTAAEHDGNLDKLEDAIENIELTPGPAGATGATGATGPAGPQGDKGDQGDPAPHPTLQANHVFAGPTSGTAAPAAGRLLVGTDLPAIGDGLILVLSNKGETATAGTNYVEWPVPVPAGNFTLTAVRFGSHIDNTGSSSSTFNAYRRTAAGTKTSVLTGNATLASGASLVDVSATITGGTFTAGDRIGVDLVGVGTGAQGLFAQFLFTRSAV